MGKIETGILGGFSGKVGTVVGGKWKGIDYIRVKGVPSNPNTEAQQEQRSKFKTTIAFLKPAIGFIRAGFNQFAVKKTEMNVATAHMLAEAFDVDGALDMSKVLFSDGSLPNPDSITAPWDQDRSVIDVTFDSAIWGEAKDNDRQCYLVYNTEKGELIYNLSAGTREMGQVTIITPDRWIGGTVHVYSAFSNEKGKLFSKSMYLGPVKLTPVP